VPALDNVLMPTSTVAELVNEARRGSAEARDELVRRHHREAAILAAAMVNDPSEAEDLSQEAFIRAFRNLDLLVDPSRFAAWLRRIVIGVSIDWLRSFRPDLYRGWTDADEMVNASRDRSPLDHLLHSEMVQRVGAALEALPPRYRVPIRLYHLDGLSHAKIAEALGVPVATVRSLVARARRKLAPLLAEYAPEATLQTPEVFEEQVVARSAQTRFLHVANGTCTTRIIESAGIPGTLSIWADPLYEGPVPGGLTDAELLDVRSRHLAGSTDAALVVDPVNDMERWRTVIEGHESYDELILWFEHDLFDQLCLIQLLAWIRERLPAAKAVSLVCVGSFPGHPRFKGLGELTPDELASLLETRQHVSEAQYSLAQRAWRAFREPTPEAVDNLRQGDTTALPYLAAAVARFLQEYPWTTDGLSRTERRLLELAAGGTVQLSAAFPRMHAGEEVYYVTDRSLATLADTLSRASPPLLTLARAAGDGELSQESVTLRDAATLTDVGRAVLAGKQDRVATCGIDRWLGGVHLQGDTDLWRWDDERHRITRR
jgi:RNA polymerase sigma factor (sigma-70 family)